MIQSRAMIGTLLNVAAILTGGIIGLTVAKNLSTKVQQRLKFLLGAFIVYAGFSLVWNSIGGSFGRVVKQLGIVMLALILGHATGKLMRLQKGMNRLGQYARERFSDAPTAQTSRWSEGFITCSLLYCVGPMALLGAIEEGSTGVFRTLATKAVLDGLSTLAFAKTFGWGVLLSAIPVLAYQGTLTLAAMQIEPLLNDKLLVDSVNATGGFLVVFVSLIVLDVKKVPLADYLPSLVFAPLLTAWLI